MKYMGSKNRIAKDILPIILRGRKDGQWFVDCFCGGLNIIDKVTGNRIANDINPYLISFAEALSNGWLPDKNITEEMYENIKNNIDKYDKKLVGYVGFQLSYGAMWFSSYRRDKVEGRNCVVDYINDLVDGEKKKKILTDRRYSIEAYEHVKSQAKNLVGIKFFNLNYYDLPIPDKSIIYCDPPYQNTSEYKANESGFDYNRFWEWCRKKTKDGHYLYVSEYNAPEDFDCIWSREICSSLGEDTGSKKAIEKLFRHKEFVEIGGENLFNI